MADSKIVVSLRAVVVAAANVATASAGLTKAACEALLLGAHIEDVITAVSAGYQENGQDLPQGMASNLRRLAAADSALIEQIKDSGYALNNKLLGHYGVPTKSTKGAKVKAKADTNAAPATGPLLDRMAVILQEFNANILALKDDEGKTMPNIIQMQEAGLQLAALIGTIRK